MKIIVLSRVPRWYLGFAAAFFLMLTVLPDIARYIAVDPAAPKPFYNGNKAKPNVALACNVFWGEEYLPAMLAVMAENDVKATFFIGGSWAKRHPELVQKLAAAGHELGNHTYSHPHPNTLDKEQNKEQITRTEALVQEITGVQTRLYAPPYGEFNATVLAAADELGYKTIMWTADTVDWKRPPPQVIVERVTKKLGNGAIILMHPTDPTARALPELIRRIKAGGYNILPVSAILE